MQILWIILAMCIAGFLFKNPDVWQSRAPQAFVSKTSVVAQPFHQTAVVDIYSLSTCGICIRQERDMTSAGIRYNRYLLDNNNVMVEHMIQRLKAVGQYRDSGGIPVIFVGNKVFEGYTPISTIRSAMQ